MPRAKKLPTDPDKGLHVDAGTDLAQLARQLPDLIAFATGELLDGRLTESRGRPAVTVQLRIPVSALVSALTGRDK